MADAEPGPTALPGPAATAHRARTTDQPRSAADSPVAAPQDEMLIDRYLPGFDVTLIEHRVVDADRATTWRALRPHPWVIRSA